MEEVGERNGGTEGQRDGGWEECELVGEEYGGMRGWNAPLLAGFKNNHKRYRIAMSLSASSA